ncbi:MAG: D-aminoacyl-tRNA deacylase [Coprobacillus sp.]|nr:D-aminoacyl-tRNA deacylase [Coprobacillus sp.]MDY4145015.1 D-aminoacyl-tRNA deacylase [Bacilli bacterium]CCY06935.1 d-tyrosyl-tRNA(Tyr) deacylase [Coprobacillus sp. CAG:698]
MKVVLQRVKHASCTVENVITGQIEKGYLLLVGFTNGDNVEKLDKAVKKISGLRIFEDENQKMNLNLEKVNGKILSISQFTLYANTNEGNRPSFIDALNPVEAKKLYLSFNEKLRSMDFVVEEGVFGAHMDIELLNDGPCTIIYEF